MNINIKIDATEIRCPLDSFGSGFCAHHDEPSVHIQAGSVLLSAIISSPLTQEDTSL
jgi:hypothetical protein